MADIYRATTYRRKSVSGARHDARMTSPAPSTRGWIGPYLLLAVLWGCSFLFIATALQTFAPTQVAFGRIIIGFVALAVILLVRRERVRIGRRSARRLRHRRRGDDGDPVRALRARGAAGDLGARRPGERDDPAVHRGVRRAPAAAERPDRVQVGGLVLGLRRHRGAAGRLGLGRDRPGRRRDAPGRHVLLRHRQRVEPSPADHHRPVERRAAGHPAGRRRGADPAVRGLHARSPARSPRRPRWRCSRSGSAAPGWPTSCSGACWRSPAPRSRRASRT